MFTDIFDIDETLQNVENLPTKCYDDDEEIIPLSPESKGIFGTESNVSVHTRIESATTIRDRDTIKIGYACQKAKRKPAASNSGRKKETVTCKWQAYLVRGASGIELKKITMVTGGRCDVQGDVISRSVNVVMANSAASRTYLRAADAILTLTPLSAVAGKGFSTILPKARTQTLEFKAASVDIGKELVRWPVVREGPAQHHPKGASRSQGLIEERLLANPKQLSSLLA
ncbi:hypothetical protein CEXT_615871 [Caerostris extrusa]|uniref:Uncharacterized protein n=1 Tax=Caerostris extrusa TaxID=172846 RepID=A0AAV4SL89_CAEEX|nr:hypothetical protein CEXT_615871 [Caerostris extrusa]